MTDFRSVIEYMKLVKIYREHPKDKCVQMILREYASDETRLDQLRCEYFEHLKQVNDDFPFDHDIELKRRVFTRSGEPVATRLAKDIFNIIAVTEGGDFSLLREMLSTGKTRRRQQSVVKDIVTPEKCQCATELSILKDTIASIQASVLLLKQSVHASEMMRTQQINQIKSTHLGIKSDIVECTRTVHNVTSSAVQGMGNISRQAMSRVTELEDRIRLIEVYLETKTYTTPQRPGYCGPYPLRYDAPYMAKRISNVDVSPTMNSKAAMTSYSLSPSSVCGGTPLQTCAATPLERRPDVDRRSTPLSTGAEPPLQMHADADGHLPPPQRRTSPPLERCPDNRGHFAPPQTRAAPSLERRPDIDGRFPPLLTSAAPPVERRPDGQSKAFEIPAMSEEHSPPIPSRTPSYIPTRISSRQCKSVDGDAWCNEEFHLVQSRRVERFCLLGLSSRLNTRLLREEVESHGLSVKSVRVFPLRRNRRQVLVKLTLVAYGDTGIVLSNEFWPEYVTCFPWKPRESRIQHNRDRVGEPAGRSDDKRSTKRGAWTTGYPNQQQRTRVPPRFKKVMQQQTDKERDDWTRRELYYHNRYEGLASEID